MDRVGRQAERKAVLPTLEAEPPMSYPAGVRHHRVGAPSQGIGIAGDEELMAVDDHGGEAATVDQVNDDFDARGGEPQDLGTAASLAVVVRHPDRQRSAPVRRDRPKRRPLGHELVHRRRGPKDLVVEPRHHAADGIADGLSLPFLLRHGAQSSGAQEASPAGTIAVAGAGSRDVPSSMPDGSRRTRRRSRSAATPTPSRMRPSTTRATSGLSDR